MECVHYLAGAISRTGVCVCVCVCLCVCVEVYAVGVVSSPPWPSDIQLSVGGQVSSGVILLMLGPLIPFISML